MGRASGRALDEARLGVQWRRRVPPSAGSDSTGGRVGMLSVKAESPLGSAPMEVARKLARLSALGSLGAVSVQSGD